MPAVANHSTERQLANDFPTIRFLSVRSSLTEHTHTRTRVYETRFRAHDRLL